MRLNNVDMEHLKGLISNLKKREPTEIIKVMASLSYNQSIGRVLSKGGVRIFSSMATKYVKKLSFIRSIDDYDKFHLNWTKQFIKRIENNKKRQCSFGQAQKAINVFLKVYCDWAKCPNSKTANHLIPFLHVPLDRILMNEVAKKFPEFFNENIQSIRKTNHTIKNYNHSLSRIKKSEYVAWQIFFRESNRRKPILFDIIWAINR